MENYTIRVQDKIIEVGREQRREWSAFIVWIADTSLFNAIKNDRSGTEIVGHGPDGDINFTLNLQKANRKIETPEDLPPEVLMNFYQNSPWYREHNNKIINLLEISQL